MSKASNSKGDVVLGIRLHCDNCAYTALKLVLAFKGVKSAKADKESNTLTITGDVDPERIRELLQKEMKKKVEIISPPPKKKPVTIGFDKQKLIVEVGGKLTLNETLPGSGHETVVAYGNGIVAQHVHLYINGIEKLQFVFDNNGKSLKAIEGDK